MTARSKRCVSLHLRSLNVSSWLKSNAEVVASRFLGRQTAERERVVRVGKELLDGSGERGSTCEIKTPGSSFLSPVLQALFTRSQRMKFKSSVSRMSALAARKTRKDSNSDASLAPVQEKLRRRLKLSSIQGAGGGML